MPELCKCFWPPRRCTRRAPCRLAWWMRSLRIQSLRPWLCTRTVRMMHRAETFATGIHSHPRLNFAGRAVLASRGSLFLLLGNEHLHHRFAHHVRGKQALRQNEDVKLLLVEPGSQRLLCLLAQRDQLGVAIEIAVGLTRCAIGEALDLLLGEGVRQHHVVLQYTKSIGGRDLAGLELRIEKCARSTLQSQVQ